MNDGISVFGQLGFSALSLGLLLLMALLLSSYVKIATVLGMVRLGFGFSSLPSAFITGGLAISLSFFVMYPTLQRSTAAMDRTIATKNAAAITDADRAAALNAGIAEWKPFLQQFAEKKDVTRFAEVAAKLDGKDAANAASLADSWRILIPAFVVSELKRAFVTGMNVFLPFLVIDIVVMALLAAVGFEKLEPQFVSIPFKVAAFVLVDGWTIITSNLVSTYTVG